jgi:Uma2 family endonuclease
MAAEVSAMVVKSRHFSRAEYQRLAETGVLTEDDRVELLEGTIAAMSPIGPYHSGVVNFLTDFFTRKLAGRAVVCVQNPLRIDEHSEPQPDLMLLKPRDDFYRRAHPTPADVRLLVEVADASLELDRDYKAGLYARAGVPEYWLVDLVRRVIVVHGQPAGDRYALVAAHAPDTRVVPSAYSDVRLSVGECFV